jgi:hypothetical protein
MSRQEAWRRILGIETVTPNKHMVRGTEGEEEARNEYEAVTGLLVQETGFWVHPEHPWLGASPDGLVGEDGLVEIKRPWTLPVRVPVRNRIQMYVQMLCTGRVWCDYFAFDGRDHFLQRVYRPSPATSSLQGLVRALKLFHEQYVVTNTEPPRKKRRTKR